MSKVVFVGGFGSGKSSTKRVGEALTEYYDDVKTFRFSEIKNNPEEIAHEAHEASIVTHSAGALALNLIALGDIEEATLIGAPLRLKIRQLLSRTAHKTILMNTSIHSREDMGAVASYTASTLAEFAAHPVTSVSSIPEIARTNSVDFAVATEAKNIATTFVWPRQDVYFQPTQADIQFAHEHNARTITDIDGQHDEVILRPAQFLAQVDLLG